MEALLNQTTIEQREAHMVSPAGGLPTFRTSYFLRPKVTSMEGPPLKLPSLSKKPKWTLKVYFHGWVDPMKKWKAWVESMHQKHSSVWRNAGIYDSIMASIHKIHRDDELMFGLAERWCSESNTFFFPWGEATVTLEDIMILGGFSILGDHVSLPLETNRLIEIEGFLVKSRTDYGKNKLRSHLQWMNLFMDSESEIEHEAFLSLWLSRFVFPSNHLDSIGEHVFSIAIHLSRGRRLALGPAVLASIYNDLGLLKEAMAESANEHDKHWYVPLFSPLSFVQVWAWERLPPLQPEPNFIGSPGVRLARWDGVKISEIGNVRPAIDSAGFTFLWRPYTLAVDNWSFPSFYKESEELLIGGNLGLEIESFARCLRASQLVGIDCLEPYNPHRVAMQFGYDQDLPAWIPRTSMVREMAWYYYSKPLNDDEMLYLPPRLFESDVTTRYLDWWRKRVLCPVDAVKGLIKQKRSPRKFLRLSQVGKHLINGNERTDSKECQVEYLRELIRMKTENDPDVPPGFLPRDKNPTEDLRKLILMKTENDPEVPPGFLPIDNGVKTTDCIERIPPLEDRVSPAEHSQCRLGSEEKDIIMKEVEEIISNTVEGFDPEVPPGFPPNGYDCNSDSLQQVIDVDEDIVLRQGGEYSSNERVCSSNFEQFLSDLEARIRMSEWEIDIVKNRLC